MSNAIFGTAGINFHVSWTSLHLVWMRRRCGFAVIHTAAAIQLELMSTVSRICWIVLQLYVSASLVPRNGGSRATSGFDHREEPSTSRVLLEAFQCAEQRSCRGDPRIVTNSW